METNQRINIYEYFDKNGDLSQFICDGHVDSVVFRDKCYRDYFIKPMVVRHQWQKTKRMVEQRPGKKYKQTVLETVLSTNEMSGAVPVTIGLL